MSKAPATGGGAAAPNVWAHLVILCAILPLAIILLALMYMETGADLLAPARAPAILTPRLTLAGAISVLLETRCYRRDSRRGSIDLFTIGLLGWGVQVLWHQDVRDLVLRLL